jgi:hypothetical protein
VGYSTGAETNTWKKKVVTVGGTMNVHVSAGETSFWSST